jgi:hypothetical protein
MSLLFGLLALFVLTQWNTLDGPFERDEGEYAYSAWLMREGMSPYQHSFMQKPPMIIYTYWLSQLMSDEAFWPPRLLGAIFVVLTAVLVGMIARKEYGSRAGWISAWILLPLYSLPWLLPFAANTEKFMNLPMMGTLALYVYHNRKGSRITWFFAGVLAALALMYKPICLLVLVFMFLVWVFEGRKSGLSASAIFANLCLSSVGGLFTVALALSYFFYNGALGELWESSILFNFFYSNVYSWSPHSFIRMMNSTLRQWWILWILLVWLLFKRPARWWFHLTLLLIALLSAYKDPNGHYYLMALPFLAIVSAAALNSLLETMMSTRWFQSKSLPITAVIVVVGFLCWPIGHQFSLSSSALYRWTYGPGNPFHESPLVADRIAAMTDPEDRVFIAGSEPQILYYAKRKSPTRFVIMYPLMLPSPYAEKYQRETIESLQADPPKLIVLSNSRFSWLSNPASPQLFFPFLNRLLGTGPYELLGGYVWQEGQGNWLEPMDQRYLSQCSMAVFKRRSPEIPFP